MIIPTTILEKAGIDRRKSWRWLLGWEMNDGVIVVYDDYSDWLMIADYFTHE